MIVLPVRAEPVGDELNDLPIGLGIPERLQCLVEALDAALRVHEGAVFFKRGRSGQHQVGEPAGFREGDVLHDQELQFAKSLAHIIGIAVGGDGVFALDVHGADFPFVNGFHHLAIVLALGHGQGAAPRSLKLAAHLRIIHELIAREEVRHGAEVAGTLHIVMAAQRVGTGTAAAVIAGGQQQIADSGRSVRTAAMLRHAHRPQDASSIRLVDLPGNLLERFHRDAGDLFGIFQRERLQAGSILIEMIHLRFDEARSVPSLVDDVACHGRKPDQVRAWIGPHEEIGALRHLVLAQIAHDEPLAAQLVRALYTRGEHGVALRRVGADDDHQPGHLDIRNGTGVAAVLDGALQPHGGRCLAVARAVIDVVGADDLTRQLLHQVAFFVGAF